ncbi:MAG: cisplatin damage response ATP-dependent DNA ligase [Hyphomicrobiaceae bacterium]
MNRFAELLDRLVYTPQRNAKLRLITTYLRATPDPDRGYALAALTDGLPLSLPVRRTLGEIMERRFDPELYRLSRDYVGDTAETVALLWPDPAQDTANAPLSLADVVTELALIDRNRLGERLEAWLDQLDTTGRWALLKLLTGALRVGVSGRLAKTALAELGGVDVDAIEEVWHGQRPPYPALFAWLEGRGPQPDVRGAPVFRPMMLSHPLEEDEWSNLDLSDFAAEWKWDGIRIQIAAARGEVRLYSRTGDDIGKSFPDLLEALRFDAVLDGELLVVRAGEVAPFNDLQQRLNRRTVSKRMLSDYPAHVRLYDVLEIGGEDLRTLTFDQRRQHLADWYAATSPPRTDLSPLINAASKPELEAIRGDARVAGIEGLMLKRRSSPYLPGRPKGHWYKWKRAPLTADCVLMYAQRGSGKRSSFYSDFTFGVWTDNGGPKQPPKLVPVGKAYSGFTDAELARLDRFVRDNTTDRFGPVRALAPLLVVEIAFDAVQQSARHKSGIAMRFPRFARVRWDKPAAEADRLETLARLIAA